MDRTVKEIIVSMIIFVVVMVVATIGYGHEYGHAEGIYHLERGERTDGVDKSQACPGQDKVLLYHDIENDGIMDLCSTIWVEHGKIHYILSEPNENGKCECEGYLWLENDTQEFD